MVVMSLADQIDLGMSLPHRSPDPIPEAMVRQVAQRAEALGFADLWVTNNTLDVVECFDSFTVLTWAAAVTTRIRVGVSVLVLPVYHPIHVAHVVAALDRLSRGRAILGVGIGPPQKYAAFDVPDARRVRRFTESIGLIRALWAGDDVTFEGELYAAHGIKLGVRPTSPPPIWLGSFHPDALRRAARLGDGWMGAGGSGTASFAEAVPVLREALAAEGRDVDTFPISKRVFLSVHDDGAVARAEVERWFATAYGNPALTDQAGVFGTPDEVGEQLEALAAAGANHLLLNPVARYDEQVEALAAITGLA
jgi:alkanesulfonate monooxygenase SsuD/methylene tetrahydromethanopterin reductase-like flavin-dependent oxidoreductase (luciferase family)